MEDHQVSKCISFKSASMVQEPNNSDMTKPPTPQPLNVLIVDDNPINIRVAQLLLEKMGCMVYTASSGREGIEKLREESIGCVFMDCQMPELSGFETTQLIRQGEAGIDKTDVFISALTAYADVENKILCYESGMDHFIPKPLRKKSFIKALDVLRSGRSPNLEEYHSYGTTCLINKA